MVKEITKSGRIYRIGDQSEKINKLEAGNYTVFSSMMGVLIAEAEPFKLPQKVWNFEEPFIKRIKNYYEKDRKNLGILLSGIKGTGKTITSKLLCQELQLPCFLIDSESLDLIEWLNDNCQFDIVIFIDEFEKITSNKEKDEDVTKLLTIMDGSNTNEYRRTFILTSNKSDVNDFLIDRPSRIRYHKKFTYLTIDQIMAIVKEELDEQYLTDEILTQIGKLVGSIKYCTVDMILEVIKEINFFGVEGVLDGFNCSAVSEVRQNYYLYEDGEIKDLICSWRRNPGTKSHMELCAIEEEDSYIEFLSKKRGKFVLHFDSLIEDNHGVYTMVKYDYRWKPELDEKATKVEVIMIPQEEDSFDFKKVLAF